MLYLPRLFGYQPEGLIAKVVTGTGPGPQPGTDIAAAAAALHHSETQDGLTSLRWNRFPNASLFVLHKRAHVEFAKGYALANDLDHAAQELERALAFGPERNGASLVRATREHQPQAKQTILGL